MIVRTYKPADYAQLKQLYLDSSTFGGQFDEARDAEDRLLKKIEADPDAILVAEDNGQLLGSVSLIDDRRVAWLFRFSVKDSDPDVVQQLHDKALKILKSRGHTQVIVYSPVGSSDLNARYVQLGFNKGNDFTAYWKEI